MLFYNICVELKVEKVKHSFSLPWMFWKGSKPKVRLSIAWNSRMLPGRDLWRSHRPASCTEQDCYYHLIKSAAAMTSRLYNPEDREPMISLGNLFPVLVLYFCPCEEGFPNVELKPLNVTGGCCPLLHGFTCIHPWLAFNLVPTITPRSLSPGLLFSWPLPTRFSCKMVLLSRCKTPPFFSLNLVSAAQSSMLL